MRDFTKANPDLQPPDKVTGHEPDFTIGDIVHVTRLSFEQEVVAFNSVTQEALVRLAPTLRPSGDSDGSPVWVPIRDLSRAQAPPRENE